MYEIVREMKNNMNKVTVLFFTIIFIFIKDLHLHKVLNT